MRKIIVGFVSVLFLSGTLFGESLRIEIEELNKKREEYKIIDVRNEKNFLQGHILGSLNFPIEKTYENRSVDGKIVQPKKMQKILVDLGLDIDDKIVVYDNGAFFDGSRLFWALEVYGFKKVKILNGGFDEWSELGYKTTKKIEKPKPSNYIASINNRRLATKFTTQIATRRKTQKIVDARSKEAYDGLISTAKRFGHIPNALHVSAVHNIISKNEKKRLKDLSELRKVYKDIQKNQKVIIYCKMGKVSSTNYFALRELGYDVANYDASWREWGNDFSLPIEK